MPIYLDHNSTTPVLPEAAEAMVRCEAIGFANPASQHTPGRRARQLLEEAREGIARLLGAELAGVQPDRLIFTSGGTEANNLAVLGMAGSVSSGRVSGRDSSSGSSGHGIISAIEHPSVIGPAELLERRGWRINRLGVSPDGMVELGACQEALAGSPRFVSVMLGNNETGVLQPIRELAELCRNEDVPLHTDAVQVCGKLPIDFHNLGVAALSISAHKFHGPRGVGALLLRHDVSIQPQIWGGFQQEGLRPGTEPVALAVGMHAALAAWHREQDARRERLTSLRDRFERALQAGVANLVVHGGNSPRLPHTSCLGFPGFDRQALVMALDLAGVACSTGSACASGSTDPSPVLVAMGCPNDVLEGSLRFSLGATNTAAEVEEAVRRILQICNDLQSRNTVRKNARAARVGG